VVESLADEFDVVNVALAAVKLAHQTQRADDEETGDIPAVVPHDRPPPRERRYERSAVRPRRSGRGQAAGSGMARLYIGAGRNAGIRPQDLVGAIAGEAGISGRAIGAI